MVRTKQHSETILKDLLAGSGIPALVRLATDSAKVPADPPVPLPVDEMATMSLDRFAQDSLLLLVDSSLLGERVWFVSGRSEAQILLERGIPRGKIYTAQELLILLNLPGMDGEKVRRVHQAKEMFNGMIR